MKINPNEITVIHRIHDQIEALQGVVEELNELPEDERRYKIKELKKSYPDTIKALDSLKNQIEDMLLTPLPAKESARLESFQALINIIFIEEEEQKEVRLNPEQKQTENLSLYPDVQAQIKFKIK